MASLMPNPVGSVLRQVPEMAARLDEIHRIVSGAK